MTWTSPRTWVAAETVTAALLNTHVRDNLEAIAPTDTDWTDYTPTLTNITEGNGSKNARYMQLGKLVVVQFSLLFGSTSAMGSGPTISLPVTAKADMSPAAIPYLPLGHVSFMENGVRRWTGFVRLASTTTAEFRADSHGFGTYVASAQVTSAVPFTWGNSDRVLAQFQYAAA